MCKHTVGAMPCPCRRLYRLHIDPHGQLYNCADALFPNIPFYWVKTRSSVDFLQIEMQLDMFFQCWYRSEQMVCWQAEQPPQVACVSDDLKCWGAGDIKYPRAKIQGHHTIDRLEDSERRRKGSGGRSNLKGRDSATVHQTDIGTVWGETLENLCETGRSIYYGLFCATLKWIELSIRARKVNWNNGWVQYAFNLWSRVWRQFDDSVRGWITKEQINQNLCKQQLRRPAENVSRSWYWVKWLFWMCLQLNR